MKAPAFSSKYDLLLTALYKAMFPVFPPVFRLHNIWYYLTKKEQATRVRAIEAHSPVKIIELY